MRWTLRLYAINSELIGHVNKLAVNGEGLDNVLTTNLETLHNKWSLR